jgi:hypothetical protein
VPANSALHDDLDVFVREQALLRRLVADSSLPVLEVDIADDDTAAATERIADCLEATGGLRAP